MVAPDNATTDNRAWWFGAGLTVVHCRHKDAGVAFMENSSPGGSGGFPPLHARENADEGMYVLEGALRLYVGDDVIEIGPGEFGRAPRGVPHTFEVASDEPVRYIHWVTGPIDEYVEAVATPAAEPRLPREDEIPPYPDPAEIARIATEKGATILGPPGMLPTELPAS